MSDRQEWIGVDFDKTLHRYTRWNDGKTNGPVPAMLERVAAWMAAGIRVKILTARVAAEHDDADVQRAIIQAWCRKHLGRELEVVAEKDTMMIELWDDRAVTVEANTGRRLTISAEALDALTHAYEGIPDNEEVPRGVGAWLQPLINAVNVIVKG